MKTSPLDPITTSLVKVHIDTLVHPITLIINKSLSTGHFPACFRTALITPVIKKKSLDPNNLKNYHPILNLPFVSKVVKRVVAARLNAYLIQNNLWDNLQSAYMKFHSVETALVKVHNDIMLAVDCKNITQLCFIGCRINFVVQGYALLWFRSYLQD